MIRRALAFVFMPLVRLMLRAAPAPDPWERLAVHPPLRWFGWGSHHDFGWYFEGTSAVTIGSFDELHAWLAQCEYASDAELFHETDFWQHPLTFEKLRKGDCEDYALWAWRKLVELGYDADLVSGRRPAPGDRIGGHAWIVFRHDGKEYVYEPTFKDQSRAVRLLAEVRSLYTPVVGVGRDQKRFAYGGYVLTARETPRRGRNEPQAWSPGALRQ
jgi:hypothetical protein